MYLDFLINDSKINYSDVLQLLPSLELPVFENLIANNLNIDYKGEPTKFEAKLKGNFNDGSLDINTFMNFQKKEFEYDISFSSKNLNLQPIINIESGITSKGKIKGKSFDPALLEGAFNFTAVNSSLNGYQIDSLNLTSNSSGKVINFNLRTIINNASANTNGNLNFTNEETPSYNLTGNVSNLNLATFLDDSTFASSLNFTFGAEGKDLDIDSMTSVFNVELENSSFREKLIDKTKLQLNLEKEETRRKISLVSDFADFNISGEFALSQAIDIISYEAETITEIISDKIDELNPVNVINAGLTENKNEEAVPDFINTALTLNYDFEFKDFELIALLLNNDQLDINGSGEGKIQNDSSHFSVSSEIYLDYFLNIDDDNVIYLSEVNTEINFNRDNHSKDFDKLFGTLSLSGNRVYFGSQLSSVNADLIFNQSKLFFNLETEYEDDLEAEAEGNITMSPNQQKINFDRLAVNYKGFEWINKNNMILTLSPDSVNFSNFEFVRDNSSISFNGTTYSD
ncbi:MAG: hypothetical protein F9K45_07275, partial [Melioribacteraceae bacterium]